MHFHNLLFISMTEILFIAFVAFLMFGSKKLPEVAKGLGKGYREFQKAADQIKEEINKATEDIKNEANKVVEEVKEEVKDNPKDSNNKSG
ncbi:MAG: twin-arginine translocase TatA/TatE family subunit [Bacteroidales bacterium]|nr:MAG: twin-arginine translocase TatA/TatE family subunit [Bacteroidales bacterium]